MFRVFSWMFFYPRNFTNLSRKCFSWRFSAISWMIFYIHETSLIFHERFFVMVSCNFVDVFLYPRNFTNLSRKCFSWMFRVFSWTVFISTKLHQSFTKVFFVDVSCFFVDVFYIHETSLIFHESFFRGCFVFFRGRFFISTKLHQSFT